LHQVSHDVWDAFLVQMEASAIGLPDKMAESHLVLTLAVVVTLAMV